MRGPMRIGPQGWVDRVYLSKDASLSSNDPLLAEVGVYGPLAAGTTYARSVAATNWLPAGLSGLYYVIIQTDGAEQPERAGRRRRVEQHGRDPDLHHLHRAGPRLQGGHRHARTGQLGRRGHRLLDRRQRGEPGHRTIALQQEWHAALAGGRSIELGRHRSTSRGTTRSTRPTRPSPSHAPASSRSARAIPRPPSSRSRSTPTGRTTS